MATTGTGAQEGAPTLEEIAAQALSTNLGINLGPVFMGVVLDALLLGVVIGQAIKWIPRAGNRKIHIRIIAYWSMFVCLVTTIFSWTWGMYLFVFNFGKFAPFISFRWVGWYGIMDLLIVVPTQAFFAERAYRLNKGNKYLLCAIGLCMLGIIVGAIGASITMFPFTFFGQSKIVPIFYHLWPASSMAADLLITGSILFGLYRSRTGWSHTDYIIKRIIILSIEAQLPGTLVGVAFLIQFSINHYSFFAAFFQILYGKPYIIGFLAALNYRYEREGEAPIIQERATNAYALNKRSASETAIISKEGESTFNEMDNDEIGMMKAQHGTWSAEAKHQADHLYRSEGDLMRRHGQMV